MIQNTKKHRRKLAELVVASMDMESLISFAEASMQVMYEETPSVFHVDAKNYDLEGVMKKRKSCDNSQ